MKIKEILLAALSAAATFFATVFYVLFQLKKDENNQLKKQFAEEENRLLKESAAYKAETESRLKENKEKSDDQIKKATAGNHLSNAMAGLDILRK